MRSKDRLRVLGKILRGVSCIQIRNRAVRIGKDFKAWEERFCSRGRGLSASWILYSTPRTSLHYCIEGFKGGHLEEEVFACLSDGKIFPSDTLVMGLWGLP